MNEIKNSNPPSCGRKILVVEDEDGIRQAICIYLQEAGFVPVEAGDGLQGLELLKNDPRIECVIADIMMPRLDGYDMVEKIRSMSDVPVLFLSARVQDFDKVKGFSLGGDDYLTKPFSSMELIVRIKALLRRYDQLQEARNQGKQTDDILSIPGLEMNRNTREVFVEEVPVHLTPKEFSILELLLSQPGRVFTPVQIYEQVWQEPAISTDTVTVHIRRLREKIEPDPSDPQYLFVVWGVGYKVRKPS